MQKPKELGGLALPVFRRYHWATNARAMMFWRLSDQAVDKLMDSQPRWLYMEARSVVGSSLAAILFSNPVPLKKLQCKDVVVLNSIRILNQLKTVLSIKSPSVQQSICDNLNFLPGQSDKVFSLWRSKGLTMIKDFYIDGKFATFEHLYKTFDLSQSQFFRYLQVRHYIKHSFTELQECPRTIIFLVNPLMPNSW